jgi:hypothetical protein
MKTPVAVAGLLAAMISMPAAAFVPQVSVPVRHVRQFIATDRSLYVQSGAHWYRAQMAGRGCFSLSDADNVRINMSADGRFDGTSTVEVGHHSCPVAYVTRTSGPPTELLLNPDG